MPRIRNDIGGNQQILVSNMEIILFYEEHLSTSEGIGNCSESSMK